MADSRFADHLKMLWGEHLEMLDHLVLKSFSGCSLERRHLLITHLKHRSFSEI
jgi:hypothetical protein